MSYSSRKDQDRAYASEQGSRSRYDDYDYDDYHSHDTKRPHHDDRRDDEGRDGHSHRDQDPPPFRKSDTYHLNKTTKATQQQFSGTEIYPPKSASDKVHRKAQAVRSNTRIDEDDGKYSRDHKRRGEVSYGNTDNFDGAPKNKIEAKDWAYPKSDSKHSRSGNFTRPQSLDHSIIQKWATDD
jgi:hypothetical protein